MPRHFMAMPPHQFIRPLHRGAEACILHLKPTRTVTHRHGINHKSDAMIFIKEVIRMLTWTGHPLVDVGVATLCVMCGKSNPEDLTPDDLDDAADRMAEYYFSGLMTSYNACVFTMNAYDNPTSGVEKKKQYETRILRAHRSKPDPGAAGHVCPFSGRPATHLIERRQMPLLTGDGVLNFYPDGLGLLPIFGPFLVALQALPLGGRRTEGRLLIAHGDDPGITLAFAETFVADNLRLLGLAKSGNLPLKQGPSPDLEREQAAGSNKKRPKYPDAKAPTSLIANDLMKICRIRGGTSFGPRPDISVTAYWLSNSGQGPSLEMFYLPAQVTRFIRIADSAPFGSPWRSLVARAWRDPSKKKAGSAAKVATQQLPGGPGVSRNDVIADLLAIYEHGFMDFRAAKGFLRRHFLGRSVDALREPGTVDWSLAGVFMREVMGVDERQIDTIKNFADHLADHIDRVKNKGLFRNLVFGKTPWEIRNALKKAQRNEAKDRGQLLFGLDEYLDVFEADSVVGRGDWSLVRDLISIRLVEQLHKKGFFEKDENRGLLDAEEPESNRD